VRYRSSIPFLVGLLLVGAAFAVTPLFVEMGEGVCSAPGPTNPSAPSSWDCFQPFRFDARIPMLLAVSGVVLMVIAVVRMRRTRTH
jgi:hypothetical protein